ncbi:MAG: ferrochelatase [Gammaproteobacteria bacterium]|nr:ferrochelatase [Gammaproteobacteria bacterium]
MNTTGERADDPVRCRVTVILAAHGEAETPGFRENFMVGHRTLSHVAEVMPLPAPLRLAICTMGAARKRFAGGEGSPHNALTRRQAQALDEQLAGDEANAFRVVPAFGSSLPLVDSLLEGDAAEGLSIVVSMTPIDSHLACGRLCHLLVHAKASVGEARVLARFWDDPDFIGVNVEHVFSHLQLPDNSGRCALVLVMHGTLVRDAKGRVPDFHTGLQESVVYARRLREAFATDPRSPFCRIEIAHLNHDVGGEWTRPTLEEVLKGLAAEGVDAVAAYPCEYLVDGSDTVGKVAAALATGGIRQTQRLPCLNDAPGLIALLARRIQVLVSEQMDAPGRHCDACPLTSTDV